MSKSGATLLNKEKMPNRVPLEDGLVLKLDQVEKTFTQGGQSLTIFNRLNLKVEAGEIVALVGPSGAGKSTLLQIAGLLDQPTSGRVTVAGRQIHKLGERERTLLRRTQIGFVYQFHHLLPEFTALENIAIPQIIAGVSKGKAEDRALKILKNLGLEERADHRPARLSGGEQQRVAFGRALANGPQLLLADEPTGNLDPETSAHVFEILVEQVRKWEIGALIATHNLQLADQMDRVLELKAGKILSY